MSRAPSGYGRGHAPGSHATRFKQGEPSPNPSGRPRAKPVRSDTDLAAAVRRALAKEVVVRENGIKRRMTGTELAANLMMAKLPKAKMSELLAFFRWSLNGHNPIAEMRSDEVDPDAARKFVESLIAESERDGIDIFAPVPPAEPWGRPK